MAPQIFVTDIPAGGSNEVSEDDLCMIAMDEYEKQVSEDDLCMIAMDEFENEKVQDDNTG
jgi:hypothetical protein